MTKTFLAAIALSLVLAPAAMAEDLRVSVDQTIPLKLNAPASSVVIGNATVADVSVYDSNTLLVTGKAFGTTNLLVLDRSGKTIFTTTLAVGGKTDTDLTIVRAGGTYTYSCVDKCRGTPMVGDAPQHFSETMATVSGKANTAKGAE